MTDTNAAASPKAGMAPAIDAEPTDAFAAVWELHHRELVRLACLLTGAKPAAEDAVADAFARSWVRWRLGGVRNAGPYLRRAVINACADRARAAGRDRRLVVRSTSRPDEIPPDAGAALAERDRVRRALDELPVRQRAVVILRFYDDLSEAAIAGLLGIGVGTVNSHLARGLARLRGIFAMEEDSDG